MNCSTSSGKPDDEQSSQSEKRNDEGIVLIPRPSNNPADSLVSQLQRRSFPVPSLRSSLELAHSKKAQGPRNPVSRSFQRDGGCTGRPACIRSAGQGLRKDNA